jgi:general secretion pathway protein A
MLLMYQARFGLTRRPFPATPDDAFYYPASVHEAALASLVNAMREGEGLALLSGAPGTGKTLLGYCLSERLDAGTLCGFVSNSHLADRSALFQAVLYDLELPYEDGSEQVLRLRLTDYLLKQCQVKDRSVLIVDEAHHLSIDLLEELRLLGNLEAGGKKAVQIILLAQTLIAEKLACPELASLCQRLVAKCTLEPMGVEESLDYMLHHLRQAGGRPEQIIDDAGLEVLARGARGIPRLLNQAAQQALLLADQAELRIVDAEAALEALALIGLSSAEGGQDEELQLGDVDEISPLTPDAGLRLAEPTRRPA